MTEHAPDRLLSGPQLTKLAAGSLAAVSAAVIGSYLGVAGTLIGAAVASVVGSLGTEIYQRSINRGAKKLQTLAPTFVKAPAAVGTPEVAAATEQDDPAHTVAPDEVIEKRSGTKLRWKPIVIGAAAVFIIAMGAIFAVEAFAGKSLSSITTGTDTGRSTIGVPVGDTGPSPAVSPAPSSSPAPSVEPSVTPSATPSSPAPATNDTGAPVDTGTPTGGTTTGEPAPTTTGGAAPDEQQQQQQPTPGTEE